MDLAKLFKFSIFTFSLPPSLKWICQSFFVREISVFTGTQSLLELADIFHRCPYSMVCWGHLHCPGVNRSRWVCLCRPITTIVSLSTFRSWRAFLHGKQWMCQKQFTVVIETRPLPIAINEPLKCWSLWINVVFVVWFYKPSACFFTLSMNEILMRKQSEMKKASHGCAGPLSTLWEREKTMWDWNCKTAHNRWMLYRFPDN